MKKLIFVLSIFTSFTSLNTQAPLVIASIPKSGTHLLQKLLSLGTGKMVIFNTKDFLMLTDLEYPDANHFWCTHAIANQENIEITKSLKSKGIFIYRDPRDQIVSFMHFVYQRKKVWPHLACLNQNDLLSHIIQNGNVLYNKRPWHNPLLLELDTLVDLYNLYLPWRECDHVYTTTFEKLVGSKGGGSDEVQFQEIQALFRHLEIEISDDKIASIASQLFGCSPTFRSGQIGSWKHYFTGDHKTLFKRIAGDLLIELGYEQDCAW